MIITEIAACKKSKDRCNIYCEDGFVCALFFDTVLEYKLKPRLNIDNKQMEKIIFEDDCKRCFMKGCYLLSIRSRGEKELREKLKEKGFEKPVIEIAMDMLIKRGYIDDYAFATEYAEYLQKKGYGSFAVKQRLYQKGVDKEAIEMVMSEISKDDNIKAAMEYGRKAYVRALREEDCYKRRNKFIAAMGRHGFDYSIAKDVYENLEKESKDD